MSNLNELTFGLEEQEETANEETLDFGTSESISNDDEQITQGLSNKSRQSMPVNF